ncbi:MAG: hypothetical protein ACQEQF_09090 [Bacillota bacterium]
MSKTKKIGLTLLISYFVFANRGLFTVEMLKKSFYILTSMPMRIIKSPLFWIACVIVLLNKFTEWCNNLEDERKKIRYYLIAAFMFSLLVSSLTIHEINFYYSLSSIEKTKYFILITLILTMLPSGWRAVYPYDKDPTKVKTPVRGGDFIGEPVRAAGIFIIFKAIFLMFFAVIIGILAFIFAPFVFIGDFYKAFIKSKKQERVLNEGKEGQ